MHTLGLVFILYFFNLLEEIRLRRMRQPKEKQEVAIFESKGRLAKDCVKDEICKSSSPGRES